MKPSPLHIILDVAFYGMIAAAVLITWSMLLGSVFPTTHKDRKDDDQ